MLKNISDRSEARTQIFSITILRGAKRPQIQLFELAGEFWICREASLGFVKKMSSSKERLFQHLLIGWLPSWLTVLIGYDIEDHWEISLESRLQGRSNLLWVFYPDSKAS